MKSDTKAAVTRRLARIEGQVRGVSQMVEHDRYCLEVVTQVRAAAQRWRRSSRSCWRITSAPVWSRRSSTATLKNNARRLPS